MSAPGRRLYLALVHHPVLDRAGQTTTSAVTTLDVHDLARVGRTYDAVAVYVVTPLAAQQALVAELRTHFTSGAGAAAAPDRAEALSRLCIVGSVEEAAADLAQREGHAARLVLTAASHRTPARSPDQVRADLAAGLPVLLCFGTAHGLGELPLGDGDGFLPPLQPGGYNHLPVRGALAILIDRLVGTPWA